VRDATTSKHRQWKDCGDTLRILVAARPLHAKAAKSTSYGVAVIPGS